MAILVGQSRSWQRWYSPVVGLGYPLLLGLAIMWGTGHSAALSAAWTTDIGLLRIGFTGKQLFSALATLHLVSLLLIGALMAMIAPGERVFRRLTSASARTLLHTAGGALLLVLAGRLADVPLPRVGLTLALSVSSVLLSCSLAIFLVTRVADRRWALAWTYGMLAGLTVLSTAGAVFLPASERELWPPEPGEILGYVNPFIALLSAIGVQASFAGVPVPAPAADFLTPGSIATPRFPVWQVHLGFVALAVLGLLLASRPLEARIRRVHRGELN